MDQGQNNYNAAVVGERANELGLEGLEIVRAVRKRRKTGYAIAIFGATVRSLSSFALFFSNACCLQLAKLRQLWCSGIRCCGRGRDKDKRRHSDRKRKEYALCRRILHDNEGTGRLYEGLQSCSERRTRIGNASWLALWMWCMSCAGRAAV